MRGALADMLRQQQRRRRQRLLLPVLPLSTLHSLLVVALVTAHALPVFGAAAKRADASQALKALTWGVATAADADAPRRAFGHAASPLQYTVAGEVIGDDHFAEHDDEEERDDGAADKSLSDLEAEIDAVGTNAVNYTFPAFRFAPDFSNAGVIALKAGHALACRAAWHCETNHPGLLSAHERLAVMRAYANRTVLHSKIATKGVLGTAFVGGNFIFVNMRELSELTDKALELFGHKRAKQGEFDEVRKAYDEIYRSNERAEESLERRLKKWSTAAKAADSDGGDDHGHSYYAREARIHELVIAQTLLHEMMHVAGYAHPKRDPRKNHPCDPDDPYYSSPPLRAERCVVDYCAIEVDDDGDHNDD